MNCSGPGFSLHSDIVLPYIEHFGSPEQQKKFIPDMIAGKKIGAIAMTEPGAGRWVSCHLLVYWLVKFPPVSPSSVSLFQTFHKFHMYLYFVSAGPNDI